MLLINYWFLLSQKITSNGNDSVLSYLYINTVTSVNFLGLGRWYESYPSYHFSEPTLVSYSEHKDSSEKKHKEKEKTKHKDGSSERHEKHKDKHKDRDKEKRKEEKVEDGGWGHNCFGLYFVVHENRRKASGYEVLNCCLLVECNIWVQQKYHGSDMKIRNCSIRPF